MGTCAKLSITAALLGAPKLLIFDESLNGLDPIASYEAKTMLEELRAMGFAIVLTTHVLEIAAKLCNRVIFLSGRQIALTLDAQDMDNARQDTSAFERTVIETMRKHTLSPTA